MVEATHVEIDRSIREMCDRGDFSDASAAAVRHYGPEVFGFLVATHKSEQDAGDAFSDFCLALLRGIETFRWKSSLRTWVYTIARNASHHFRRDGRRRENKLTGASALDDIALAVRTSTLTFLRTESRTRLERLRDALAPEDQELLVLRVDRGFSWEEVAAAFADDATPLSDEQVAKESQRLRKRFQLLKDELRETARREGLAQ